MTDQEIGEYYRFTKFQRYDKAIHTLEGLLLGISADGHVSDVEIKQLHEWICEHADFVNRKPFSEVVQRLNAAIADNVLDSDEREDLLWFCDRFLRKPNVFYDALTSDMQRLQGIIAGVMADGIISVDELRHLQAWVEDHKNLSGYWPYDEIDSVICQVLQDGTIDSKEHEFLTYFFNDFVNVRGKRTLENVSVSDNWFVTGVCAIAPEITFSGKTFCATGQNSRYSRNEFKDLIAQLGGEFKSNVSNKVNYLIIGAEGNPCWAFSCYGRKVEAAVALRKAGHPLVMVHENDFHDAIEDYRADNQ